MDTLAEQVIPKSTQDALEPAVDSAQEQKLAKGKGLPREDDFFAKLISQTKLLVWKRCIETFVRGKSELAKLFGVGALFYIAMILLTQTLFKGLTLIEIVLTPLAFWVYVQRMVVQMATEKSSRVAESMRIMGLTDMAYYLSYFIVDGIMIGFSLCIFLMFFTLGGLYGSAPYGEILGLLFIFCLSSIPFSIFISVFFSNPVSASQLTVALLLAFFVVPLYLLVGNELKDYTDFEKGHLYKCLSLIPPVGLMFGVNAIGYGQMYEDDDYLQNYFGINDLPSTADICWILAATIPLYSALVWYLGNVIPTDIGTTLPFYYPLLPTYWFPCLKKRGDSPLNTEALHLDEDKADKADEAASYPEEVADETVLGPPSITVRNMKKSFGTSVAVDGINFNMYENQIFCLLGHNGAGKTTTINMLTGMNTPDDGTKVEIYGHDLWTEKHEIRRFIGVCPQHDVLFEKLTVQEHLLFFAQLKGVTFERAEAEAEGLTEAFHLSNRLDHLGHELSGGQQRKLSFAIAACGGSKFIVLDEPTAGMDPLARRELWDMIAELRIGRTILLTTHYMDEADILGDRVGIMSLGKMQCLGSTQFLKHTYGSGYSLIFDHPKDPNFKEADLTTFIQSNLEGAQLAEDDGSHTQLVYVLPLTSADSFGPFFDKLDKDILPQDAMPSEYGVSVTSLEDVFLKVGADHSVKPDLEHLEYNGIGGTSAYNPTFLSQTLAIIMRRLVYAVNDFTTVSLFFLPLGAIIAAAIFYGEQTVSKDESINILLVCGLYIGAYIGWSGITAQFIARERKVRLRNVLTVMGCSVDAYWFGSFLADYLLLMLPTIVMWISWGAGGMTPFIENYGGLNFLVVLLFNSQLIGLSYFSALVLEDPAYCILVMPIITLGLLVAPLVLVLIIIEILKRFDTELTNMQMYGSIMWGLISFSPHGALFANMLFISFQDLNFGQKLKDDNPTWPPLCAVFIIQIAYTIATMRYCVYYDISMMAPLGNDPDPTFDPVVLESLHPAVKEERELAVTTSKIARKQKEKGGEKEKDDNEAQSVEYPLRVLELRKVYPPKVVTRPPVVATENVSFAVGKGQVLGLLGANGAGKSTTLSMLTRATPPTSGDALIAGYSILNEFGLGARHMGVVPQNNALWDLLSVESHLYLFARLRGVPEEAVERTVEATIEQLELRPHRKKLSMRLSGGMKRKLCVAIALIGDPDVILLDEPSAGLDPVSRRNLWTVILRTMSERAVVLTTHSMEETEALCSKIAIMVKGQIRAIGTKQSLKHEFGSGFEVTIKPSASAIKAGVEYFTSEVKSFLQGLFPSVHQLANNGGLLTFQIPREEMSIGHAFQQLQQNCERLNIEYYQIAQPTLEQVFIKTVDAHTPPVIKRLKGGSKGELDMDDTFNIPLGGTAEAVVDEYYLKLNRCGCNIFYMKASCGGLFAFGLIFVIFLGFIHTTAAVEDALFFMLFLSWVTCCGLCWTLLCPCCKPPPDLED